MANKVFWSKKLKKYVTIPLARWKQLKKLALLFLLAAPLLWPQANPPAPKPIQPLQIKVCAVRPCQFDNPLIAGSLRIIAEIGTCSPITVPTTCKTISDSQGNTWQPAVIAPNFNGTSIQYALGGPAGYDVVSFMPDTGWVVIMEEWPPATGLGNTSTGTYTYDNGLAGDPNGGSSDLNWTHPILITEPCELVIGAANHGSFGGPWVAQAGPNFTMRAQTDGALALEDATAATPGAMVASLTWNDYAHWDMAMAAFKMGGCK